jgi:hypothetical protein
MPFSYQCSRCQKFFSRDKTVKTQRYYCSIACYHEAMRVFPAFICLHCKKSFRLRSGQNGHTRKYCTRDCYFAASATKIVEKTCQACNKSFSVAKIIAHRFNVCSIQCSPKKTISHTCKTCGKVFRGRQQLIFCSRRCYLAYTGETQLETAIRIHLEQIPLLNFILVDILLTLQSLSIILL